MTTLEALRLLGAGALAGMACTLIWLFRAAARPSDDMDRWCAQVDAEIDAARQRHPSRVAR